MATFAPNSDIICAIPLPSPVPPPVMNAILPSNAPSGSSFDFTAGKKSLVDDCEKYLLQAKVLLIIFAKKKKESRLNHTPFIKWQPCFPAHAH